MKSVVFSHQKLLKSVKKPAVSAFSSLQIKLYLNDECSPDRGQVGKGLHGHSALNNLLNKLRFHMIIAIFLSFLKTNKFHLIIYKRYRQRERYHIIIRKFAQSKLRKRSKLLRMNNDLLVEYVLGYELAIYRVFWSSAFCITSNNSFCIAKVLIFPHFTKNSQRKILFRPHFG